MKLKKGLSLSWSAGIERFKVSMSKTNIDLVTRKKKIMA